MSLPDTVTTLHCPNGSVVHVVGTVHFSKESVQDVRTVVTLTKPQVLNEIASLVCVLKCYISTFNPSLSPPSFPPFSSLSLSSSLSSLPLA